MQSSKVRRAYSEKEYFEACAVSNQVFHKEISPATGVKSLVDKGINETSANDFIHIYASLYNGESFLRGTGVRAVEIFTNDIISMAGMKVLINIIQSLGGHIESMRKSGSPMRSMEALLNRYKQQL